MTSKPWVELTDFVPSDFSVSLLKSLESVGLSNAVLHGGALRDMYLGRHDQINDYDVHANVGYLSLEGSDEEKKKTFVDHLKAIPGSREFSDVGLQRCARTGAIFMGVEFKIDGKLVSLGIDNRDDPFFISALYADAPISSIGMNAQGAVIAHPDFEKHWRENIYAPFDGMDDVTLSRRFSKMVSKFPALVQHPSIKRDVPAPAPLYINP